MAALVCVVFLQEEPFWFTEYIALVTPACKTLLKAVGIRGKFRLGFMSIGFKKSILRSFTFVI